MCRLPPPLLVGERNICAGLIVGVLTFILIEALPFLHPCIRVHTLNSETPGPPGLVEKALSPLLEWAEEVVPRSRWRSTPIFLFATAGLRKLPAEHQENILDTVRHILGACPFRWERTESFSSPSLPFWYRCLTTWVTRSPQQMLKLLYYLPPSPPPSPHTRTHMHAHLGCGGLSLQAGITPLLNPQACPSGAVPPLLGRPHCT